MYSSTANIRALMADFHINGMMFRYSAFARENIFLERHGENYLITIDNQLIRENRPEGLFLNLERLVARLREQSSENPDPIDLEEVIHQMEQAQEVQVHAP